MDRKESIKHVDHTLLAQTATWEEIKQICDDAIRYGTASVCIPPSYVNQAKEYVKDRMAVCTVIGFPNGYMTTKAKVFEAQDAIENGASEIDMVRGLDIGADDYIKKPFSIIEFITRVKAVLRRTMEQTENKFMSIGEVFLDDERHMAYVKNDPVELTYKEYELLKLLMRNAGIVMTREMIMQRVWDTEFEGESRTVDMHIKTLRKKLGENGSRIKTVRNVGYVME